MDFNSTVDLIIKDLEDARAIIDDLRNYPGVPAIQVELAKSKCKSASDVISMLKILKTDMKSGTDSASEKTVKKEFLSQNLNSEKHPATEYKEEIFLQSPESQDSLLEVSEEKETEIIKNQEKTPSSSILADRFTNISTSLNEQLGNALADDKGSANVSGVPVANMSEVIGINDRFLFIREIFGGNTESYEKALSEVEAAKGFSEAKDIIFSKDNVIKESEAMKQFLSLIKRKYPENE
mgnify:CR=1 FL=1